MALSGYHGAKGGEVSVLRLRPDKGEDAGKDAFDALVRIYEDAIPASERKSAAQLAAMLARPEYCFLVALRADGVVGFSIAVSLKETDAALLEYMAVAASERGAGVGAALFRATAAQSEFAGRFLLIEADSDKAHADDHTDRVRRKAFYMRQGARELAGVRYRMPQLTAEVPPAMDLLVYRDELPAVIATRRVRHWIEQCHAQVYGAETALADNMLTGLGETIRLTAQLT